METVFFKVLFLCVLSFIPLEALNVEVVEAIEL